MVTTHPKRRRPTGQVPLYGGWHDYQEWADHDFRPRAKFDAITEAIHPESTPQPAGVVVVPPILTKEPANPDDPEIAEEPAIAAEATTSEEPLPPEDDSRPDP